jgi:crotonobetainyl-CoA:carnitine CoA-transferase CaiB-like acyl-CoA transferase
MASLMDDLTGQPRYVPTILADKTCGIMAVQAILAALFHRERTGRGQFVEVPMFETMVSFLMVEHLYGRTFDPPQGPTGYSRVVAPWRRPYRTADGYVCMMAYTDRQWLRFWSALGKPEMMKDPRFVDMPSRTRNIEEVYRIAGEQLASRTTGEWIALLDELEIPSGPVKSLDEVLDDPHLAAVGFFKRLNHPATGEIVMPDTPLQFSDSPAAINRLPPGFGEHSREVLREFGLEAAEIDALAAAGGTTIPEAADKANEPVI